jgi:Protein of unknown function (DUF1552)
MSSRVESKLGRRRFLRGAGAAGIALPFLFGREGSSRAASAAPERFISVYFGNGLPADLTQSGLTGPLSPLAPFASQLTTVRGINAVAVAPGTGHIPGSGSFCCAMDSPGGFDKGGPSLDWVAYQNFKPPTPINVLAAGVFGTNAGKPERLRWTHSWRAAGQPVSPYFDTLSLFNLLFANGSTLPSANASADAAAYRYRVSVLDAVMNEYKQVSGPTSPYPASVRTLVSDHLALIRDLETRVMALHQQQSGASAACKPGQPLSMNAQAAQTMANYAKVWPVMTDLYVTALRCDLFRFGNVLVTMGGDIFPAKYLTDSATNTHGEWFHNYPNHRPGVGFVINWEMQMIAQFLSKLNDPAFPDSDGKTFLDNTTVLIGTELSDPPSHSRQGMTFFLAGAKGRFKPGVQELGSRTDVDLYNTVLRSMGVPTPFGKMASFTGLLPIQV